jgi:hypothetical protein
MRMRRWKPWAHVTAVMAIATSTPLLAQTGQSDRALMAWDSVLAEASDLASLPPLGVARTGDAHRRNVAEALLLLRRGELTLRRGDLAEALRLSTLATKQQRQSPWGPFVSARALAAMALAELPPGGIEGQFDGEALSDAVWRHYREVFRRQPTFAPARRLILTPLVAAGDRVLHDPQREIVLAILAAAPDDPDALLVHARDLRTAQRYDSALAAFDAALPRADRGLIQLERARTLLALGDSAGAVAAYLEGTRYPTPTSRIAYRYDLEWILEPDTLALFNAATPEGMSAWLQRFWAQRDAEVAAAPGTRLREHLRRWVVAHREYRAFEPWRRTQFKRVEVGFEPVQAHCVGNATRMQEELAGNQPRYPGDLRARESLLDHRGLIYLRHGEPMRRIGGTGGADDPDGWIQNRSWTEFWLYWIEGAWRVIHFTESMALGTHTPTTMRSYISQYNLADWFSVGRYVPEYLEAAFQLQLPSGIPPLCRSKVQPVVRSSQAGSLLAATTEGNAPRLVETWNAVVQSFALGHATSNDGRALVTFAIPMRVLATTAYDATRVSAGVHFRLVAYNAELGKRVAIDTVRRFLIPPAAGGANHLSGWFELPLTAGRWQIAVRMDQGADTVGAYSLVRDVVIPSGDRLTMSDVIPGLNGSRPLWAGDGEGFPLGVLGAWPQGSALELYYEVRGMTAGEDYTAELEVRSTAKDSRDVVTSRTTQQATGALTRVRQSLALTKLTPGTYRVTVRITRGTETLVRERPLLIVRR